MLLRTLKSLFSRSAKDATEPLETQVLRILREKKAEQARQLLAPLVKGDNPDPQLLGLMGEVEYHLKNNAEAESLLLSALRLRPGIAQAHYGLSLLYYDAGRIEEALAQAQYSRNLKPDNPRFLSQLGLCHIAVNEYSTARDVLRQALLQDAENVPALNNLGIAMHGSGQATEAAYYFHRALELDPAYAPALENLRNLYGAEAVSTHFDLEAGALESKVISEASTQPQESEDLAEEMEALFAEAPDDPARAIPLVHHYIRTLRLEEARDVLHIALAHHGDSVPLLLLTARLAHQLGQNNRSKENYEKALALDPDNVEGLLGLGQALRELGQVVDALVPVSRAASLSDDINAQMQLAFAQSNGSRYEACLETCNRLEQRLPHLAPLLFSCRAVSHAYLGDSDTAFMYLDKAQKMEQGNTGFNIFRGILHLQQEHYRQGWEGYRYRFLYDSVNQRLLPFPLWHGEDLVGKTILVLSEQGLGDQVMFASCLPDLQARLPNSILLEAHERVAKTLQRSFPDIQVIPGAHKHFDWLPKDQTPDYYVPLADLPSHFRNRTEDFPEAATAYLKADDGRVAHWKAVLAQASDRPKVGFSWRGGLQKTRQIVRTITLEHMLPILSERRTQFVNLQYGPVSEELSAFATIHGVDALSFPEAISDLDEFAALISALDLVVTVCNTTVHYAGALGKPCWVLTPHVPEWRYGLTAPRMRWYPSTRMFRQPATEDWHSVIKKASESLTDWLDGRREETA